MHLLYILERLAKLAHSHLLRKHDSRQVTPSLVGKIVLRVYGRTARRMKKKILAAVPAVLSPLHKPTVHDMSLPGWHPSA